MKRALVLAALAISCKSSHGERPGPTNGIELVSPGAEPKQLLRYTAPKGTKALLELALDSSLSAGDQNATSPTIAFGFELAVTDVLPTGQMKLAMTVVDTSAKERAEASTPPVSTEPAREAMRGVIVEGLLAPDGKLTDVHLSATGTKPPPERQGDLDQLLATFGRAVRPLPDVPVGVGATWKSTQVLDSGGMKMTATTTTVLTKAAGTELGYTTTGALGGPDQVVRLEGTPIKVEHLTGSAEGHGTIDLAKLVFAGELNATVTSEMSADNEKTPMRMVTKLVMTPK